MLALKHLGLSQSTIGRFETGSVARSMNRGKTIVMTDEIQQPNYGEPFFQMRERIDRNTTSTFGGAFVIIPPAGGGEPMETLILDAQADPAQFLMWLSAKITNELEKLKDKERSGNAFGRR